MKKYKRKLGNVLMETVYVRYISINNKRHGLFIYYSIGNGSPMVYNKGYFNMNIKYGHWIHRAKFYYCL